MTEIHAKLIVVRVAGRAVLRVTETKPGTVSDEESDTCERDCLWNTAKLHAS
jgi:hypothetical protein